MCGATTGVCFLQCDHEDANGQFEINWGPSDSLVRLQMMQMPSFLPRQARDKHRDSSTQNKGDADRFALHTRQVTADRHGFFKYMAQSIAEKHGMRATFMPKPFINLSGAVSLCLS